MRQRTLTHVYGLIGLLALMFDISMGRASAAQREISLNGSWQITDSVDKSPIPKTFAHTVPVPGLAHSAQPSFADVDRFEGRELIEGLIARKVMPESSRTSQRGVSGQTRNYFWYRRTFLVPQTGTAALLKINKAQFGTVVYVNGIEVGAHDSCFTSATFDATRAIRWGGENEVVVRIGAHPGVLPSTVNSGQDFEKFKWTPGIYDDVSLIVVRDVMIENVQIAPDIKGSMILVETSLKNFGHKGVFHLEQSARTWKTGETVERSVAKDIELSPGERKIIRQTIAIPGTHLWSPEDPFLYQLTSRIGSDEITTRFGMREFRFDTASRRAYLNGQVYFLRGTNVTLHRFFEDPDSGTLPWNDAWVRTLLIDRPKQMHWNSMRFTIGPVPQKWLDIADEAGLLIQNEYFVWTGGDQNSPVHFDEAQMTAEFKEWMQDNWNHPSLVLWDASNESWAPIFGDRIIPVVRKFDLSKRPWENSYNPPQGPDDPVEDHPYLFVSAQYDAVNGFKMTELEQLMGVSKLVQPTPTGHAMFINEYGWLWLNRDGSPTTLTDHLYDRLLGPSVSGDQRLRMQAYLLAGETEFWRAYRQYAGVLHFTYLAACGPRAFTCDNFKDVKSLTLSPYFLDYVGESFKPLGVYINFWQPEMERGARRTYSVMLTNDVPDQVEGELSLEFVDEAGKVAQHVATHYTVGRLGTNTYNLALTAPLQSGSYILRADATTQNGQSTLSRRWLTIHAPATTSKPD